MRSGRRWPAPSKLVCWKPWEPRALPLMQFTTGIENSRRLRITLSANRKLALRTRTLFASAQMPRAPEGASACFGALAGILAAGPVETIIQLICDSCYELLLARRRAVTSSRKNLGVGLSLAATSSTLSTPRADPRERVGTPFSRTPTVKRASDRSPRTASVGQAARLARRCLLEPPFAVCSRSGVAVAGKTPVPIETKRRSVVA
jgi:hypothetical protein